MLKALFEVGNLALPDATMSNGTTIVRLDISDVPRFYSDRRSLVYKFHIDAKQDVTLTSA